MQCGRLQASNGDVPISWRHIQRESRNASCMLSKRFQPQLRWLSAHRFHRGEGMNGFHELCSWMRTSHPRMIRVGPSGMPRLKPRPHRLESCTLTTKQPRLRTMCTMSIHPMYGGCGGDYRFVSKFRAKVKHGTNIVMAGCDQLQKWFNWAVFGSMLTIVNV